MNSDFFFQKKVVRRTTWKFRLLFLASITALIILPSQFWLSKLYQYLTPSAPIEKVDAIILEGWTKDFETSYAMGLFRKGFAKYLMTTGYKPSKFAGCYEGETWAEMTADQIKKLGVPESKVIAIIQKKRGTYAEAVAAKKYFDKYGIKSVILVTFPGHMRRTYSTFSKIYGDSLKIIPAPIEQEWFSEDNWWKSHDGLEFLFREYIKLVFYWFKGYI